MTGRRWPHLSGSTAKKIRRFKRKYAHLNVEEQFDRLRVEDLDLYMKILGLVAVESAQERGGAPNIEGAVRVLLTAEGYSAEQIERAEAEEAAGVPLEDKLPVEHQSLIKKLDALAAEATNAREFLLASVLISTLGIYSKGKQQLLKDLAEVAVDFCGKASEGKPHGGKSIYTHVIDEGDTEH